MEEKDHKEENWEESGLEEQAEQIDTEEWTEAPLAPVEESELPGDLPTVELVEAVAQTKKKWKHKKRWLVLGGLVLVVAILIINGALQQAKLDKLISFSETTVLERVDMVQSIGATGTVESADSASVYSTQVYPVQEVLVEVGDYVEEGDLLCVLDPGDLQDQIKKLETSLGVSAAAAQQQVKTAQDAYNAAQSAVAEGKNATLVSAQSQVQTAYTNWQNAQDTYEEYKDTLDDNENAQLLTQDSAVDQARSTLDSAEEAYDLAKEQRDEARQALRDYEVPQPDDSEIQLAKEALDAAQAVLTNAQSGFQSAQDEYIQALNAYTTAPEEEKAAKLAELTGKESAKNAAQSALTYAENDYNTKKQALQTLQDQQSNRDDPNKQALQAAYDAAQSALDSQERLLDNAQTAYDNACAQRDAAYRSADSTLSNYSKNVDAAYTNYLTALDSLEAAQASVESQLQSSENSLAATQIGADQSVSLLELAQMKQSLDETKITAPAAGTVTAVYAEVGSSGSGLLFVIEDVDALVVETTVKEYDIGTVKEGMAVTIKSDATGDTVYEGQISRIAPTSTKNAMGQTETSGDVLFATEVAVLSPQTDLRIGMSVRLNYIIDEAQNVLAAPYDAIYVNEAEQECVIVLEEDADGQWLLRELPVQTGIENDLDIAISGTGVQAGLRILNDPTNYTDKIGQAYTLTDQAIRRSNGLTPYMMSME